MKNIEVKVQIEASLWSRLTRFSAANNLSPCETVSVAAHRLIRERRDLGLCVLCDGGEMFTHRFTPLQLAGLRAVAGSMSCGLAETIAALALGMLDMTDPDESGADDNFGIFDRHIHKFIRRRGTPARPALPPRSGLASCDLDMGADTLAAVESAAKSQGMGADQWINNALADFLTETRRASRKAARNRRRNRQPREKTSADAIAA